MLRTSALVLLIAAPVQSQDFPSAVVDAIRVEATRPNRSDAGRPLPLAENWNTGGPKGEGFNPTWQMQQIAAGKHLLPWFPLPESGGRLSAQDEAALKKCADLKLPIAFVGTQWERLLTADKKFATLDASINANVFSPEGKWQPKISPFAPVEPWKQVGAMWGASPALQRAMAIYPDPPRVFFVSNNEHTKLTWHKVEEDRRFAEQFGGGRDDEFKRKAVGDGWIAHYRALQEGFRSGLANSQWQQAATFVGYNAFGQEVMGRWIGWPKYSLHVAGRITPYPLAWDGGSPSFYTNNWEQSTDYTVFSPQVQCMNWVFMHREALKMNPEFWFEFSLWDGHTPGKPNDKYRYYADRNQTYPAERYGGMAQFGLWLLRPRAVREFRAYRETRAELEGHFQAVIAAVDRVYANPTLAEFWRFGQLVPNRAQPHPYGIAIPDEWAKEDRWFRLSTSVDPQGKWKLDTELKVFALALVSGKAPSRKWLVYIHSPLGDMSRIAVTIPGYKVVTIDSTVAGSFYVVSESTGSIEPLAAP